jgi:molybdate transport system substrate-binding protein
MPSTNPVIKAVGTVLLALACSAATAGEVTVYAAASLTNALTELAAAFQRDTGTAVKTSFAASGTLAKQIEAKAPADLFISADSKWVDYLDGKGKIDHDSRVDLLGNELVLIVPKGKNFKVQMEKGFAFAKAFEDNLCTGETESVPVGVYAKEALTSLGWWNDIKYRIVGTDDVRGALDLVQRGECAGIVYESDAKGNSKIDLVAPFPVSSHKPIVYPMVLVTQAGDARAFYDFLKRSGPVFAKYGFKALAP